jgi:hypothetical protein
LQQQTYGAGDLGTIHRIRSMAVRTVLHNLGRLVH